MFAVKLGIETSLAGHVDVLIRLKPPFGPRSALFTDAEASPVRSISMLCAGIYRVIEVVEERDHITSLVPEWLLYYV